jgi:Carboxypeptidase regulatory-like domain
MFTCGVLAACPLLGQHATIQGRVMDGSDPCFSCRVRLLNQYGQTIQGQMTDENGRYQFTGLEAGNYSVRVVVEEYEFDAIVPVHNLGTIEARVIPEFKTL